MSKSEYDFIDPERHQQQSDEDPEHGDISAVGPRRFCSGCESWIPTNEWYEHDCSTHEYEFIDPNRPDKIKSNWIPEISGVGVPTQERVDIEDYPELRNRSMVVTDVEEIEESDTDKGCDTPSETSEQQKKATNTLFGRVSRLLNPKTYL